MPFRADISWHTNDLYNYRGLGVKPHYIGTDLTDQNPETIRRISTTSWALSVLIHCAIIGSIYFLAGKGTTFSGIDTGKEISITMFDTTNVSEKVSKESYKRIETVQKQIAPPEIPAATDITIEVEALTEMHILSNNNQAAAPTLESPDISQQLATTWTSEISATSAATASGASFFGLRARGGQFVYVVDNSGSMAGPRLAQALDELSRSINSLKKHMSFFIIFYNSHKIPMPSKHLVKATPQNKKIYLSWAMRTKAGGGTNPVSSIEHGIHLAPDAIWLLSDGKYEDEIINNIYNLNRQIRIPIHTLAFSAQAGVKQLEIIANQNYGKFIFIQ